MSYYVYLHKFPNGKYYVGITRQEPKKRWANGLGYPEDCQELMFRAIKKYGWENIEHQILHSGLTEIEAKELEIYYITEIYHSNERAHGYNRTKGGDGVLGFQHSKASKLQISKSLKKAWQNDDLKKRMSQKHAGSNNGNYGKKLSKEQRQILSECAKQRTGDKNPFYGKHHSAESKQKMSKSHTGQMLGGKNPNAKAVRCIETGEVFDSASTAARKYKVSTGNISSACRGDSHSAVGFHWEYIA